MIYSNKRLHFQYRLGLLGATCLSLVPLSAAHAQSPAPAVEKKAAPEEPPRVEDIIVTGSRIARAGYSAPTPTTVIGVQNLQARGAVNISEQLNEIPSFRPTDSATSRPIGGAPGGGFTTADLRGLGAQRTLVLQDGRRIVPAANPGTGIVVDLNLIPTTMIQRVDVVTGGASAAYGSDAVAGVVNIILDKEFNGFKADASYGITDEGDNDTYRIGMALGTRFGDDRGHLIIGGEYVSSSGVTDICARDWSCERVLLSSYPTSPARPAGEPSRIVGRYAANKTYYSGGVILGVNADTNPANGVDALRGIAFGPGGVIVPFNYGKEVGNVVYGQGAGEPKRSDPVIALPMRRYSVLAHVDYDVTDDIKLFAELGYASVRTHDYTQPTARDPANPIIIRRDNPYLPSAVAQIMDANGITQFELGRLSYDFFDNKNHAQEIISRNRTDRVTIGASGNLGGTWNWQVYGQTATNHYNHRYIGQSINSRFKRSWDAVRNSAGQIVCRVNAVTVTDPACVPVNLFGNGSPDPAAIAYFTGDQYYSQAYTQNIVSAELRGDPFSTWAGPVSVAFGAEYRSEKTSSSADRISIDRDFQYGNYQPFSAKLNVKEVFFEAIVPLAKDLPFAKLFELNGAVRRTDYSTSGGVTTYKIGGTYEPVDWIRLRATRSRDIRAANLSELTGNSYNSVQLINPFTGNLESIRVNTGGNPALKPERSDSTTIGIVLTAPFAPTLRFSADYFKINVKGAVVSTPAQQVVDNCAREIRSGTPGIFCTQVNYSGNPTGTPPTFVMNVVGVAPLNVGRLTTEGVDFEASYSLPLFGGDLNLRALATYTKQYKITNAAGTLDYAGVIGRNPNAPGVPKWQGTFTSTYTQGPLSGMVQLRYVKGGLYDVTLIGPSQDGYSPTLPNSINDNYLSDRLYVSTSLTYKIRENVELYGVVDNLFDKDPAFPYILGRTSSFHDMLGRRFTAGVRVKY